MDEELMAELALLYNHKDDDSRQFTRWQMVVAMRHGISLADKALTADAPLSGWTIAQGYARQALGGEHE